MDSVLDDNYGRNQQTKIVRLCQTYPNFRKIRPDGNCFYRAALFGTAEATLRLGITKDLLLKLKEVAETCKSQGYDSFAVDEFHELVNDEISSSASHDAADVCVATLENSIAADPSIDGYFVAFARCACGAALKQWKDDYASFLPPDYTSIDSFCRNEVDPMYKDADQMQIVALARILGIRLRIAYVDQSDGDEANIIEFGESSSPITVHMVYKPGHFDLIYPEK